MFKNTELYSRGVYSVRPMFHTCVQEERKIYYRVKEGIRTLIIQRFITRGVFQLYFVFNSLCMKSGCRNCELRIASCELFLRVKLLNCELRVEFCELNF